VTIFVTGHSADLTGVESPSHGSIRTRCCGRSRSVVALVPHLSLGNCWRHSCANNLTQAGFFVRAAVWWRGCG